MLVGLYLVDQAFIGYVLAPHLRPSQEKPLLVCKPIDGGWLFFPFQRFIEGMVAEGQSAQVGNILPECKFSIDLKSFCHLNGAEIILQAFSEGGKIFGIFLCPPVVLVPAAVVLRTLVVETMGNLMPDHAYDGAVVDGIVGIAVKERRLEDGCRENDLVVVGVLISIDGLRRHPPFRFVDRLSGFRDHIMVVPEGNVHAVLHQFVWLNVDV